MKKNVILFGLSIPLLLVTCGDPLQQIELSHRKIVTLCFISPQDTAVSAIVYWTEPFLLQNSSGGLYLNPRVAVTKATVSLNDGTNSVQLNHVTDTTDHFYWEATNGYYSIPTSQFPILAGKTYTLTVTLDNNIVAKASCKVPAEVPQIDLKYFNAINTDQIRLWAGDMLCNYEIHWRDLQGAVDYYRVGFDNSWGENLVDPNCHGIVGHPSTIDEILIDQTLLNDNITDGMDYTYKNSFPYVSCGLRITTISAKVLHVDEHYYLYHRSIRDQMNTKDNPYCEPSLIYTNFEGGVGVFAAYNRTKVTLPFVY